VRGRPLLIFLVLGLALGASGTASAYPWPVKPFNKQHPIRANFGDPRTVFHETLLANGLAGPGAFQFHNGIDIVAPDGTPVYPVVSGTVRIISPGALAVRTDDDRAFQYFHVVPVVHDGQHVIAKRTVLGHVMKPNRHVHLTEIRGFRVWNPLARGSIAPYQDHTVPTVESVTLRPTRSLVPLDLSAVCGTVSIVAAAFDRPPLPVIGTFAGFPVAPAFLSWSFERVFGSVFVRDVPVADFRTTLPLTRNFWNVYARGTFQNSPRFSNRQYYMAGRFYYNLANVVDTRSYPNGLYEADVSVSDMRGNSSELAQQFTIKNVPGTETGCPPPQPPQPPEPSSSAP
jgi:hypothetical protein